MHPSECPYFLQVQPPVSSLRHARKPGTGVHLRLSSREGVELWSRRAVASRSAFPSPPLPSCFAPARPRSGRGRANLITQQTSMAWPGNHLPFAFEFPQEFRQPLLRYHALLLLGGPLRQRLRSRRREAPPLLIQAVPDQVDLLAELVRRRFEPYARARPPPPQQRWQRVETNGLLAQDHCRGGGNFDSTEKRRNLHALTGTRR